MSVPILFMQSQSFFGSDSVIHAQLMRHFDRREVEVHVACTTQELADPLVSTVRQLETIPDLHVIHTDFGPSTFGATGWERFKRAPGSARLPGSLLALAAYVRRHRIQVIHGTEKPRDAFYGVLLGKLTGAKSVVHMHVAYGEWQKWTVKWALKHADAIVGVSRFVSDSIIDAGFPRGRVFTAHNCLDLSSWDPGLDGRPVRRSLGIPEDAPVVEIISRLFKWKGQGDLIEAMATVRRAVPEVRLVIVGEDDPRANPGGGSYRAELEAQVRRLGLQDRVVFTGFRTDVARLLAAFDVFAHPSWEEPFGVAFLEAMAMEKPVVAWASGGAPEVIAHGETGLLVERGSVPQLAQAVTTLLRDPALRRRLGRQGRRRVAEAFSPQQMCQAVLHAYRATLQAPSSPANAPGHPGHPDHQSDRTRSTPSIQSNA